MLNSVAIFNSTPLSKAGTFGIVKTSNGTFAKFLEKYSGLVSSTTNCWVYPAFSTLFPTSTITLGGDEWDLV